MSLTGSLDAFAVALAHAAEPTAAPTVADAQALWTMWTQIRPLCTMAPNVLTSNNNCS